ncbi:pyruvate dehydrogenase (acetyl-transferring), homodimeric type [Salinisphaera sp.]|uniref:pyruvate dehydrogenase (acetyl-transferring), homodimeric type n=1 Tax=Salinisphaera sp. TaxID=1914330 RepID=UPI002D78B658|nr:pyruvate dehydrogenase (acetyl-transferring), homodimeric type [Salinisphaera sp.]HET7314197.1 pyruvate dehydrogenase (acetyl-transferring), homodimeric type [Salinisphaera sp.]
MAQASAHPAHVDEASDVDPQESAEWRDALDAVIEYEGPERAHFLLEMLIERSRRSGAQIPYSPNTAYVNTIPPHMEAKSPGDPAIEWRIRSYIRWNAMAMVVQANRHHEGVGGHIASFASAATLYEVGFNHFFHAPSEKHGGDLVFFQGHSAPGFYARSYLEGRLTEDQLYNFRAESTGKGLPSYPHAWLMPDYWQFATVSMGIGPINAIYQARFMRYMRDRGVQDTTGRHVWCFCGDGEMDEPESKGAIGMAARENLDNLIFVVNCNLQRLDGPVRGDAKIVDELEGFFRGAGWNVIKVLWGALWDGLLAQDHDGKLVQLMNETVDGEYQAYKARGGKYTREKFFGKYPELEKMVASMSDEDIARLNRGGHDPHKIYAAYHQAVNQNNGKPTVILAKTVKGYGMGEAGEGQNITHQQKKMAEDALKEFRDRFEIPISDDKIADAPFYKPDEDSDEMKYLHERRKELGGYLPQRRTQGDAIEIPELSAFDKLLQGSGDRGMATTMVFTRILQILTRDKNIKDRVVPIIPDEARTFGMEGMFRSLGIYSPVGQLFTPEDSEQLAFYKEATDGQILEEGITEAGAMSSFVAAATSYSNHGTTMIPFYAFYSMFGFQRVGDLCWAAGDMRARGFMLGGTAGRTTINGEGLQHQDGHNPLMYECIPNCRVYDPTFSYEMVVIIHHGLVEMFERQQDVFYYLTMMNENYTHPAMPEGIEDDIIAGMYKFSESGTDKDNQVNLLGSGTILREVIAAAEMLEEEFDVGATVWSAPSFPALKRDGADVDRWNMLHPEQDPRTSFVADKFADARGPAVAATDYVRALPEMIRPYMPVAYHTLGTDGFGRSDTREALREFFEVDRRWITVCALKALADEGRVERRVVSEAIRKYGINPDKPNPLTH